MKKFKVELILLLDDDLEADPRGVASEIKGLLTTHDNGLEIAGAKVEHIKVRDIKTGESWEGDNPW